MWTRSLSSWLWGLSFVVVSGVGVHSVFAVISQASSVTALLGLGISQACGYLILLPD